jgi:hypothetical protein
MNTDYQDIKSYKKPNICENLLKPVLRFRWSRSLMMGTGVASG